MPLPWNFFVMYDEHYVCTHCGNYVSHAGTQGCKYCDYDLKIPPAVGDFVKKK